MRKAGITVGLGTDATNTSDQLNMFEAQRLASFVARISSIDTGDWLTAADVFAMATSGSAAVLGQEQRLGRLAEGFQADIVLLDLAHIHYWPLHDITRQLVFSETGAAVTDVLVAGRHIFKNRRHITIDVAAVRSRVEAAAARLAEASTKGMTFARQLEDYVGAFCSTQMCRPLPVVRHLGSC
jgi:guanine deaminase